MNDHIASMSMFVSIVHVSSSEPHTIAMSVDESERNVIQMDREGTRMIKRIHLLGHFHRTECHDIHYVMINGIVLFVRSFGLFAI